MWFFNTIFVACALVSTASADLLSQWVPSECTRSPLLLQHHLACPSPWKVSSPRRQKPKTIPKSIKFNWKGKRHPSWEGPYDCVGKYCTYFNPRLNGGIVLISVESNIPIINRFPVHPTYSPSHTSSDEAPFYATQIPGKGIGLIARRTIRRNEVIMRNTPALLVQFGPHLDFPSSQRDDLYNKAVRLLPTSRRLEFLRQIGDDVQAKVDKNAFRLFINGKRSFSGHIGVYPDISRFNHDCRPKYVPPPFTIIPQKEQQTDNSKASTTASTTSRTLPPPSATSTPARNSPSPTSTGTSLDTSATAASANGGSSAPARTAACRRPRSPPRTCGWSASG